MFYVKLIAQFFLFVIRRFFQLGCTEKASSLSYTFLLSLVPLMAVLFAGFSSFAVFQELFDEVEQFVFSNFVPSSSEVIKGYLKNFVGKASQLTLVGLLGLFVVALMLMWQIDIALNQIWAVNKTKNLLRTFLTYWAVLTLGPIFIGISLMVTSYIVSLPLISDAADSIGFKTYMLSLIPLIMTLSAFTLVYLVVPNTRVTVLHALVGGLTATLLFELAKKGFALYISHNTTYNSLYGTLAAIPIFLLWIYISWVVTLLGAVTTRCMSLFDFSLSAQSGDESRFLMAFHILRVLSKAAQKGQTLSEEQIQNDNFLHTEKDLDSILTELEKLAWIHKTENEFWALSKDLDEVTLWILYEKLPYSLPKSVTDETISSIIGQSNKALSQELNYPLKAVFARYE